MAFVSPGTAAYEAAVPDFKAARYFLTLEAGSPAEITAGPTVAGTVVASLVFSTEEYTTCATEAIEVRIAPLMPPAAPRFL